MWPTSDTAMHVPQEQVHDYQYQHPEYTQTYDQMYERHGGDMSIGMDFSQPHMQPCGGELDMHHHMQQYGPGLDTLFPAAYGGGDITGHVATVDYQYNDMVHEYH